MLYSLFRINQNFKDDLFKLLDYLLYYCEIKISAFADKDI